MLILKRFQAITPESPAIPQHYHVKTIFTNQKKTRTSASTTAPPLKKIMSIMLILSEKDPLKDDDQINPKPPRASASLRLCVKQLKKTSVQSVVQKIKSFKSAESAVKWLKYPIPSTCTPIVSLRPQAPTATRLICL